VGAFVICVIPALLVAAGQPIWSRVDEAQHWDYVAQLAHGTYPVEGRTLIRQDTLDLMAETGIFRWNVPGQQPVPMARSVSALTTVPAYLRGAARQLWIERHIWQFSYEADQPPLFYLAALPFWEVGNALAGSQGAVYAVRAFDALLVGLLGALALALARLLFPTEGATPWLAVVMLAVLPGALLNATQVTNDTLAAVLGAVTLLAAISGRRRGWPWRWQMLTGLAFGAAMLTKLTTVGLALPLAAAFCWPLRIRRGAVTAAVAGLVLAPWLAWNEHLYGHLLPSAATRALLGQIFQPAALDAGYLAASLRNAFATFWAGEPYREVPLHQLTTYLMAFWCLLGAVGLALLLRRRAAPRFAALGLTALACAGELVWGVLTLRISGIGGWLPGRYLFPALVAAVVIVVGGSLAVLRAEWARGLLFGAFTFAAAVNVGGFLLGFTGFPVESRTGPAPSATVYAIHSVAAYAGVLVTADRLAADPLNQCLWIHITAHNGGASAAEWWPVLYVTLPGRSAVEGEYGGSTAFPDALGSGVTVNGWAKVPIAPSELRWPEPVTAQMVDIAVNGYREVGELELQLAPA
jgi:4-amino-4-deoxy-L-arabinose transferase-like glycosyltransferase